MRPIHEHALGAPLRHQSKAGYSVEASSNALERNQAAKHFF